MPRLAGPALPAAWALTASTSSCLPSEHIDAHNLDRQASLTIEKTSARRAVRRGQSWVRAGELLLRGRALSRSLAGSACPRLSALALPSPPSGVGQELLVCFVSVASGLPLAIARERRGRSPGAFGSVAVESCPEPVSLYHCGVEPLRLLLGAG